MKKPISKKERMLIEHNKWLRSMGVSTAKPKKPRGVYDKPDLKVATTVKTSDTIGNGYAKKQNAYSGSGTICVGQAYNKGNYVVLTEAEAKDPATGKRRY